MMTVNLTHIRIMEALRGSPKTILALQARADVGSRAQMECILDDMMRGGLLRREDTPVSHQYALTPRGHTSTLIMGDPLFVKFNTDERCVLSRLLACGASTVQRIAGGCPKGVKIKDALATLGRDGYVSESNMTGTDRYYLTDSGRKLITDLGGPPAPAQDNRIARLEGEGLQTFTPEQLAKVRDEYQKPPIPKCKVTTLADMDVSEAEAVEVVAAYRKRFPKVAELWEDPLEIAASRHMPMNGPSIADLIRDGHLVKYEVRHEPRDGSTLADLHFHLPAKAMERPRVPEMSKPAVIPAGYTMTAKAGTLTYAAFRAAGWTDQQLLDVGYMERCKPIVAAAEPPAMWGPDIADALSYGLSALGRHTVATKKKNTPIILDFAHKPTPSMGLHMQQYGRALRPTTRPAYKLATETVREVLALGPMEERALYLHMAPGIEMPLFLRVLQDLSGQNRILVDQHTGKWMLHPAKPEPAPFVREERYIVIKRKHLTPFKEKAIRDQLAALEVGTVECVVAEAGKPEYEITWNAIEQRVAFEAAQNEAQG